MTTTTDNKPIHVIRRVVFQFGICPFLGGTVEFNTVHI